MISDVLSEASRQIREYLDDPTYSQTYRGKLRLDIERVMAAMESLRAKLDRPPADIDDGGERSEGEAG
jgi:hypothetical protein